MRSGSMLARIAALAVIATAILLPVVFVILPLAQWKQDVEEAVEAARLDQVRLADSIERLALERAQLSAGSLDGFLWSARQLGAATARVQATINDIAAQNSLSIRSFTPTGTRSMPIAEGIAFRIEIEATLDRLTPFLVEIEYHTPALLIDRADLRRLTRPGADTERPSMFVQLEIVAPIDVAEEDEET